MRILYLCCLLSITIIIFTYCSNLAYSYNNQHKYPPKDVVSWAQVLITSNKYDKSKPIINIATNTIKEVKVKFVEVADFHPATNFVTHNWVDIPQAQGQFRVWVLFNNLGEDKWTNQLGLIHVNCLFDRDETFVVDAYTVEENSGSLKTEWSGLSHSQLGKIMTFNSTTSEELNTLYSEIATNVCIKGKYLPYEAEEQGFQGVKEKIATLSEKNRLAQTKSKKSYKEYVIDASSLESFRKSSKVLRNSLSDEKRKEYDNAVTIMFSSLANNLDYLTAPRYLRNSMVFTLQFVGELLHDKTAEEIIADSKKIKRDLDERFGE